MPDTACAPGRAGRRSEAGVAVFFVAILVVILFGIGALVVDGGHAQDIKARCQATADAAALAAGDKLPDLVAARAAAMQYGTKNMDEEMHGIVVAASDVEFGSWDSDAQLFTPTTEPTLVNSVRVTARRGQSGFNAVETTLGRSLGSTSMDVASKAVALASSGKTWNLVLLQDVTNSFSAEIALAKVADKNLLDCFHATVPPASQLGIVTFTGWSRVVAPLTSISTGYALLADAVNGIKLCGSSGAPACSGTDIAAGLEAAVNMLAAVPEAPGVARAILLVSDGQPQPDAHGSHPGLNLGQMKKLASVWADNGAAAGISIHVVYYDGDNDSAGKTFLKSLVRGDGVFLSTPDPVQIPTLLKVICSKLSKLSLVD